MRCFRTSSYVLALVDARVLALGLALCLQAGSLACSIDGTPKLRAGIDGGLPLDSGMDAGSDAGDAGDAGSEDAGPLLNVPEVESIDRLTLEAPIAEVQQAGVHTLLLHSDSGVSLLDLTNPSAARVAASMASSGRAIATRFDAERQVLWILSVTGELRAYRLTDLTLPLLIGSLQLPLRTGAGGGDAGADAGDDETGFVGLALGRERLYALDAQRIVPVSFGFDSTGSVGMTSLTPIAIDEGAERIAEGGPGLYVAFAGGVVRSFRAGTAPVEVDEVSLRADIVGWAVHGQRLLVALAGVGVRVVELRPGDGVEVLLRMPELDDAFAIASAGQLAVVALERGVVLALDLSTLDAARSIVSFAFDESEPPTWIATAQGNLLLGNEDTLRVVGLPPIVLSSIPGARAGAVPRNARIPLRLSKPVLPGSLSIESLVTRCDGGAVPTTPAISADGLDLTLSPASSWPASASCEIRFLAVGDALGFRLTASDALRTFTTQEDAAGPIPNPASAQAHVIDGRMTGWSEGNDSGFEYDDIDPAQGMLGDFYADYDGERMWLLFDALGATDPTETDCYTAISGYSEDGADVFEARIHGDGHTELIGLSGPIDGRMTGDATYGASRGASAPHMMFEAAIETGTGAFRFQVHAPNGGQDCAQRRTDPISFGGSCSNAGCTLDPTARIALPLTPDTLRPQGMTETTTPTLSWISPDFRSNALSYEVRVSSTGSGGHLLLQATTHVPALPIPAGMLAVDQFYVFEVRAYSPAGRSGSAQTELSIVAGE